ncbi:unnamed protein product [Rhodiola kirilowii]
MACPHVTGAVAYLKLIKSALMNTAWPLNASAHPDKEFAYGSGHTDPVKAANPGLIFDISKEDHAHLICNAYDNATCQKISGEDCADCPKAKTASKHFNYPS